ncbi:MAG: DUF2612 domain-containing protein [Desulfobulbaceae bacterium]|nr:DUF2612 domain-containing protein [Desulfobulbaceae bacterium]
MTDIIRTIISQYANSPIIRTLIDNWNENIDLSVNFRDFEEKIWNIETAVGFGLDIWGKIVGVSRYLALPELLDYFGFDNVADDWSPFDVDPFYSGLSGAGGYELTDEAYRSLIMIKALANISGTTTPELNRLLQLMFAGRGRFYALDLGGMQGRYVFEFWLTAYEISIITASGVFPRPAGVNISVMVAPNDFFGFAEAGEESLPFGAGTFYNEGLIYVK